jgi:hypothetical protein
MNIFYLDPSPRRSVDFMSDKHIVKMILESAQMLCTAHQILDSKTHIDGVELYKVAHKNHPSSVWVRSNKHHYNWLYEHFVELSNEYTQRYKKTHTTYSKLSHVLLTPPQNIPSKPFEVPPQCMPDEYKTKSTTTAYLKYYAKEKLFNNGDKKRFARQLKKLRYDMEEYAWINQRKPLLRFTKMITSS